LKIDNSMGTNALILFLRILLVVSFQVLVLNNIQLMGYLNPYFYIWIILFAKTTRKAANLMWIGFFVGIIVDLFENSGGLHASATLTLAFARPALIRLISTKGDLQSARLSLHDLGLAKFTTYTISGILLHHFILFFLEAFRFSEFFSVSFRVVLSAAFTFVLLLFFQMLFGKKT
jgi:rod shape-determining protein MreD